MLIVPVSFIGLFYEPIGRVFEITPVTEILHSPCVIARKNNLKPNNALFREQLISGFLLQAGPKNSPASWAQKVDGVEKFRVWGSGFGV